MENVEAFTANSTVFFTEYMYIYNLFYVCSEILYAYDIQNFESWHSWFRNIVNIVDVYSWFIKLTCVGFEPKITVIR